MGWFANLIGVFLFFAAFVVPVVIIASASFRERLFEVLGGVSWIGSRSRWELAALSFIVLMLASFIVIGMAPAPETGPSPMPTPTPTFTPTPTPSPSPTPTSTPTPSPTPTPTSTVTSTPSKDDEYYTTLMKVALRDQGFDVESVKVANGRDKGGDKNVIIAYRSSATTTNEISTEMGSMTGVFAGAVKDGWDIDVMVVVMGDLQGTAVGTWYCEESWIQDYLEGSISDEELVVKVLGTWISL